MSEALGQDVYHYHLHVVYIPVVEKQILWSKRCKDKALVGTVKETIMQVSRSKKWESKVALDEQGNPLLTSKGKKVLRTSYSVLQDDFFNYMKAAGYTDVERGERGSTEEHLTVTQFKVAQEQQRLEDVTAQIAQTEQALDTVQAAVEKKQKELQSPAKADQRTAHHRPDRTGNRSMGKKTITGNITLTPSECSTLKDYAVNGILAKAENSRLEDKLQQAQKSAAVWKQRYESLKEHVRPYLEAVKLAPEKVRAFLDAILTRTGKQGSTISLPAASRKIWNFNRKEFLLMTNLTTKLNKLVLDNAPSKKLINACAEIDIESCFDPIFEPPIDFLEECRKRWENRMNPFTGTVERKIGNTWYLLETVCDGNEPLTHKVKRLIFSDKEALCS